MKVLLDEDVPVPLVELVRHLLRGHHVDHIYSVGWGSKTDVNVYKDARARGYEAVVTNNLRQLKDPAECDAIQRSALHVVFYAREDGLQGLGLACGAICAAIRPVITDLETRKRQHNCLDHRPSFQHATIHDQESSNGVRVRLLALTPVVRTLARPRPAKWRHGAHVSPERSDGTRKWVKPRSSMS